MSVLSLTIILFIIGTLLLIVVLGPTPDLSGCVPMSTNLPWGNIEAL